MAVLAEVLIRALKQQPVLLALPQVVPVVKVELVELAQLAARQQAVLEVQLMAHLEPVVALLAVPSVS